MSSGEKPLQIVTGMQNSATAIARGQAVIQNSTSDDQLVIISTANAAKPRGIAFEASPGQTATAAPTTFQVATRGVVKVKAGGTVTQGSYGESDASGNLINATAGAGRNVLGRFLESGVSGDLVMFEVHPANITVT